MTDIYSKIPSLAEFEEAEAEGRVTANRNDDYVLFKYGREATFKKDWDAVTLHARGIIFDELTREVVAIPFAKFFNVDEFFDPMCEIPETGLQGAEILEKLDGSMGLIWKHRDGELRVATPGSMSSEQALWATQWLKKHPSYSKMRDAIGPTGPYRCVVAEILYLGSRMVLKYDTDELRLIAVQGRYSGGGWGYMDHVGMEALGREWNLGTCLEFNFDSEQDMEAYLDEAQNFEGFVLHWPRTGFRLKMKSDEYVRWHRILSNIHPNRVDEAIKAHRSREGRKEWQTVMYEMLSQWPEETRKPYEAAVEELLNAMDELQETTHKMCRHLEGKFDATKSDFMKNCALDLVEDQWVGSHVSVEFKFFELARGIVLRKLATGYDTPMDGKVLAKLWPRIRESIEW